jgi:hypothetical protein
MPGKFVARFSCLDVLSMSWRGAIGVEARVLADSRAGEAELPVAALDRLIETLGLRLMREIPRHAPCCKIRRSPLALDS